MKYQINYLSEKIAGEMDANLIESIISLFNQGILVHYVKSPRTEFNSENCNLSIDAANCVRFEGREKIIRLEKNLENEIRRHKDTKRLLEEAEKVIEFYAEGNSHYDSKYEWDLTNHFDSLGTATLPSGETAREFLKKITDIKLDI